MITDELITKAIKNAPKDQYGQTPNMEKIISRLFPSENENEVIEFLKTSKKYMLSKYGWKYGTYEAICLR